jgi:uncharacterized protein YcbX
VAVVVVDGTVEALTSYPIKGCAGVGMSSASMTRAGLPDDRTFMIIDEGGVFRSQRRDPRMALIRPDVSADGTRLTLRAPGAQVVHVPIDLDGPRRDVRLFRTGYQGIDQGDQAAAWLSGVLGVPCRLVRVPPEHDRVSDGETPGTSAYADSCANHLLSRSSLDLLNTRLADHGAAPVAMNRFRPNIVVAGWAEPHTEDRLRRLTVGAAELAYAKLAIRCVVTTIEQGSGARTGPEPLRTLATYRRREGGLAFGVKFAVTRPGVLAVGDRVVVSAATSG